MKAFFVARVSVQDSNKFQQYAQQAAETMKPFGGVMIARGQNQGSLTEANAPDNSDHQSTGIAQFPTMQALDEWYQSAAYQAIISLRDEAALMSITKYQMPS
jgi:uncharacterized protein (DUF1330 family)